METDEKAQKKGTHSALHTQTQCGVCTSDCKKYSKNLKFQLFGEMCLLSLKYAYFTQSVSQFCMCAPIYLYLPLSASARVSFSFKRFCYLTLDHSLLLLACGGDAGFAQHTMQRCRFLWTMLDIFAALLCFVFI